jgi:hypothetical protein
MSRQKRARGNVNRRADKIARARQIVSVLGRVCTSYLVCFCYQRFNKLEMALDPSEFHSYDNPSDEADLLSEADEQIGSEGEAQETDQDEVSDSQESNDHVPRWYRKEFKEQFKAGVSGAHTRKRKTLASSQRSPPPPKHGRKSGDKECCENDVQEMKYLLQKLCKKMERNKRYLKEIQEKDRR